MRLTEDFLLTYVCNSLWQLPLVGGAAWLAGRMLAPLGVKAQCRLWTISLLAALL